MNVKTTLGQLRITAILEGLSYLILVFIAMPLKYGLGMPEMVSVVGMIHGILFVVLVFALVRAHAELRFSMGISMMVFVLALVPFGAWIADARYLKNYQAPAEASA